MKLRLAKKIIKAVETPRESAYSDHQIGAANRRYARTASAKEARRFWYEELVPMVRAHEARNGPVPMGGMDWPAIMAKARGEVTP